MNLNNTCEPKGIGWMNERGDTVYSFRIERQENPTGILCRDEDHYYLQGVTYRDLDFMEGNATEEEMQSIFPCREWSRAMILSPRHGLKWGKK